MDIHQQNETFCPIRLWGKKENTVVNREKETGRVLLYKVYIQAADTIRSGTRKNMTTSVV